VAGHHALVNVVVAEPERPGVHHDGLVGVVEEGVHGEVLVAHRIELIVEPSGDYVGFVPPIAVLSHFLSALLAHSLLELASTIWLLLLLPRQKRNALPEVSLRGKTWRMACWRLFCWRIHCGTKLTSANF